MSWTTTTSGRSPSACSPASWITRRAGQAGVPIKTRHNEVAPGQYEIAPIYENSNVGTDHQQLTMQVMQSVARKYGLVCLLHEKPFAGVNGSGKHNNWSMGTDTGHNLLEPGETPMDNVSFMFFCAAVIQAVNLHQGLLRASVANIGQDHRLGANEAPPAIISIFLGAELEKAFEAIATGEGDGKTDAQTMELGASVLPPLPMHGGDRNRTSPFAFTGNKFEFRAVGASDSLAFPNTVLNTIVAESIDDLADGLEKKIEARTELAQVVQEVVAATYKANKQVSSMGDNYDEAWHEGAEKGGSRTCVPPRTRCQRCWPTHRDAFESTPYSPSASSSPATRCGSSSTSMTNQHRGRDRGLDRPHDAAAGGAAPSSGSTRPRSAS